MSLIDRFCALLRERAAMPSMLLFFAGIYLLSQLSILFVLQPVGIGQALQLQTTLSPETYGLLVDDLYRRGVVENYLAHYYYDFLHPVWYATLLALLLARGLERHREPARCNRWLLVPYAAGLLELVENGLHIYMVVDTANITAPLVWLANGAGLAKWILVVACVAAVVVLHARATHNR
ncbi:MAG: hypothetical protein ACOY33_09775 [Pseudomonadota bacterium]